MLIDTRNLALGLLVGLFAVGAGDPPKPGPDPRNSLPDTASVESEPAPLIVPGAPPPPPAERTRAERAKEQLTIGVGMERSGNFPAALLAYQNAASFDSTIKEANYRLGLLESRWGRWPDAEAAYREELRRNPGHVGASRGLALALSARGRHIDGVDRLRKLIAAQPTNDENWYALGIVYENALRHQDAAQALRKAIELAPERAIEHRDLGVVLTQLKQPKQAAAEYHIAARIDPRDPSVWVNLGNLHARAGRSDSAVVAFRQAESVDPGYGDAYQAQIVELEKLKRYDDIADAYLRWVTAKPDDFDLRLRAVRHLAKLDRRDRALEIARDGVRSYPNSPSAHVILGMALDAYGNQREALAELRAAEAMFKGDGDRKRTRALIDVMRAGASDSLRKMFVADSVAHLTKQP